MDVPIHCDMPLVFALIALGSGKRVLIVKMSKKESNPVDVVPVRTVHRILTLLVTYICSFTPAGGSKAVA